MNYFKTLLIALSLTLSWGFALAQDEVEYDYITIEDEDIEWEADDSWEGGAHAEGGSVLVNSASITINEDLELSNLTINEDCVLTIEGELTITNQLVVNGELYVNSTLIIKGNTFVNGTIYDEGSCRLDGKVIINGTFDSSGDVRMGKNFDLQKGEIKTKYLIMSAECLKAHIATGASITVSNGSNLSVNAGSVVENEGTLNIKTGSWLSGINGYFSGTITITGVSTSNKNWIPVGDDGQRKPILIAVKADITASYNAAEVVGYGKGSWTVNSSAAGTAKISVEANGLDDQTSEIASLFIKSNGQWTEATTTYENGNLTTSYTFKKNETIGLAIGLKDEFLSENKISRNDIASWEFTANHIETDFRWIGNNSIWNDPNNWLGESIPTRDDEIVIGPKYMTSGDEVDLILINLVSGESAYIPLSEASFADVTVFPVVSGETCVAKSVTIEAGANLTIDHGTLYIYGPLNVEAKDQEGVVTVNNDYNNSSSLRYTETNYGKFVIKRTLQSDRVYYIGSATKEGTANDWISLNAKYGDKLQTYNFATGEYSYASTFESKYGAAVKLDGYDRGNSQKYEPGSFTQIGTPMNGEVSVAVSSEAGAKTLICNPYLMPIHFVSPQSKNKVYEFGSGVEPSAIFRRYENGGYYYSVINATTGEGVASNPLVKTESREENDNIVLPQQGFFVISRGTTNNWVKFNNQNISLANANVKGELKSIEVVDDVLRLTVRGVSDDTSIDETALVFREGGSANYFSEDSRKSSSHNTENVVNEIYAIKSNVGTSVGYFPVASEMENQIISLGIYMTSTEGIIAAKNLDIFNPNMDVILHDDIKNVDIDLRKVSEYRFTTDADVRDDSRFYITLKSIGISGSGTGALTAVDDNELNKVTISYAAGKVNVENAEGTVANIYDMAGHKIATKVITTANESIALNASKGIYAVEIASGNASKTIKINVN